MLVEDTMLVKSTYPNALSLPSGPAELGLGLEYWFRYEIGTFTKQPKWMMAQAFFNFWAPMVSLIVLF
jgi:hypothetical protein